MLLRKVLFLIALLSMWNNPFAFEGKFITHSVEEQTYIDKYGELRGKEHGGSRSFQLELVRAMMVKLNHQPRVFEIYPFKRGLKTLQSNNEPLAFFSITRTPKREGFGKWVGPLTTDTTYLYELKSAPTGIKSLEDAQKIPICVLRGGFMDTPETDRDYQIFARDSFNGCFKMLVRKRVQLTQATESDLLPILKSSNIDPELIKNTQVYFLKKVTYLAFSHKVRNYVVDKWQMTLDDLKNSGKYNELYDLYFSPE